ncbi:thiamine pyrophosphate-dependent enzyme [Gordonia sp. CPCC 205515]|uniref:thiamine pyrophosphate-dependent enzyme n=1 Tax=Gordonia sp. CPCC 205515 TaxID=3140791 RepID=UPI003AF3E8A8
MSTILENTPAANTQEALRRTVDRREFVSALLARVPDALVVTGLGSASYDVYAAGERDRTFYLWGAMGGAVPVALGLALARPDDPVVVITGDGEMLMGIGTLGSVAVQAPPNLTIVVLDNQHFGETGMQRSHSGLGARLSGVAAGFGIQQVREVDDLADVEDIAAIVNGRAATTFVQVHIDTGEPPRALPPRDGVAVKNKVRAALGFDTF